MNKILTSACSTGLGLLIAGGAVFGGQAAFAAEQPVPPDATSATTATTTNTDPVAPPQVRGYLGQATQTAAQGVTPESMISEGAVVQLVNDEQIDGVYRVVLPVPAHTSFVSATEGGVLVDGNVVWTFNVAHDGSTRIVKPVATFQVDGGYWGPTITNSAQVLYSGGVFTDDPRFTYSYAHTFAERPAVPLIDPAIGLVGAGVLAAGAAGAIVLRRRASADS